MGETFLHLQTNPLDHGIVGRQPPIKIMLCQPNTGPMRAGKTNKNPKSSYANSLKCHSER